MPTSASADANDAGSSRTVISPSSHTMKQKNQPRSVEDSSITGITSWMLATFLSVVAELIQGVQYCITGLGFAFSHSSVRALSLNSVLAILFVSITAYIFLLLAIWLPATVTLWLTQRWFSHFSLWQAVASAITPKEIFARTFHFAPLGVVLTMNNLTQTYEGVFWSVIRDLDPDLYAALRMRQRVSWYTSVLAAIRRTVKLVCVAMGIAVLRYIPVIHRFVPALWSIRLAYSLYHLHTARQKLDWEEQNEPLFSSSDQGESTLAATASKSKRNNRPAAATSTLVSDEPPTVGEWELAAKKTQYCLAILSLMLLAITYHPFSQQCALIFLHWELSCRALLLELMDPYFARLAS
jgi:hypothetical protein